MISARAGAKIKILQPSERFDISIRYVYFESLNEIVIIKKLSFIYCICRQLPYNAGL